MHHIKQTCSPLVYIFTLYTEAFTWVNLMVIWHILSLIFYHFWYTRFVTDFQGTSEQYMLSFGTITKSPSPSVQMLGPCLLLKIILLLAIFTNVAARANCLRTLPKHPNEFPLYIHITPMRRISTFETFSNCTSERSRPESESNSQGWWKTWVTNMALSPYIHKMQFNKHVC